MHFKHFLSIISLASAVTALPQPGLRKAPRDAAVFTPNKQRADAVKEAFMFSWDGYYKYAFPHDELHPLSNSGGDSRNGWGASAIDALSTAIVMGAADVVDQILDYVPKINFDQPLGSVSLFETTIRYLGGFLASYDFLGPQGPLRSLVKPTKLKNVDALLSQARHLADNMKYAFDTKSGVPHNDLFFPKDFQKSSTNGLAVTGTLVLEWMRLSDLTGDPQYGRLADRAEQYLLKPQPPQNEPFPGLIGSDINIDNGTIANNHGSWSGGADSFYEYLIKMWVYDPSRFGLYRDRWELAATSSMRYLASHPKPDMTFLAQFDGPTKLQLYSQHLTCFDGGNFILGGLVLGKADYTDFGLKLVDSCHRTYTATATGIGPEAFSWDPDRCPADQKEFFAKNGFWITSADYILRPEVIESIYYAYRATGDPKYQEWVWDAFVHINATARAGSGFAELTNVNVKGGGDKRDNQESFWFAEVLKYTYLTFAEDAPWQIAGPGKKQEWVFNTEAHPFRVISKRL